MDPLAEMLEKANALAAAGQKAEAVQCYRRFLASNPRHAEATAGLGLALAELGNLDEAIPTLRAAIALKPDFATAHQVFLSYAGLHLMLPCQPHPRYFQRTPCPASDFVKSQSGKTGFFACICRGANYDSTEQRKTTACKPPRARDPQRS